MSKPLPTIGPYVVAWMQENLVHGEGDRYGLPYRLEKWMKAVLYRVYAYDPLSLIRPVETVTIGVAKGNAKTEFAAAIAAVEAAGPTVPTESGVPVIRPSPNVPIGAASREQANLCFGALATMLEQGPMAPMFEIFQYEIKLRDRPGRIYRIAAEAGTQDGTLPTAFVADEVHEWTGRKARVHTVVQRSLAKRQTGTLEVNISTAGDPNESKLLKDIYDYGSRVRSGEIVDPSTLFVWFEPSAEVDLDDPKGLREALRAANPSSFIDIEKLAREWEKGQIEAHIFRRYHLDQWVTSGASFLRDGVWVGLKEEREPEGQVAMAFDGSHNRDSTVLVGCDANMHLFLWGGWERPPGVRDWKVPRNEVDVAVEKAFRQFPDMVLFCDPAKWPMYLEAWADRFGEDRVLEYPQSHDRMAPATSRFYDLATTGGLTHDGNKMLARHMEAAITKQLPQDRIILAKNHKDHRIDAAVASVMAVAGQTILQEMEPEWANVELV